MEKGTSERARSVELQSGSETAESLLEESPDERTGLMWLYGVGGISLIISSILLLLYNLLQVNAGEPPSNGAEILSWAEDEKLSLELQPELLFFVPLFLIPGLVALYDSLGRSGRVLGSWGCGMIAAAIPLFFVVALFQGRLVYPVFDKIVDTPAVAEFVLIIWYAGLHSISLVLSFAFILLSVAMLRSPFGKITAYLGLAAGVFQFISADPWITGPVLGLIFQVVIVAWFVAVGARLYSMGRRAGVSR